MNESRRKEYCGIMLVDISTEDYRKIFSKSKSSNDIYQSFKSLKAGSTTSLEIPRPHNAFILYRKDKHPAVKQIFGSIPNAEMSKILTDMWSTEQLDVKIEYQKMANQKKNGAFKQ
nr:9473_t:CDS:2 [Entrophospora candida]